jgi:(p)ppGpp synthase/HD superfamily hydrolase
MAGLMHDVIEDTTTTRDEIAARFGPDVAALVSEVTDVSVHSDGVRAVRKAIDREHVARASHAGQSIKLADLISNTRSIAKHDKRFARVYLGEKRELLKVLTRGDKALMAGAVAAMEEALRAIGKTASED